MIYTDRIITVRNGVSNINSPIILYRGDREIEVTFKIPHSGLKFSEVAYGQLIIDRPDEEFIFSSISEYEEGGIKFVITREMIDELVEVGFYTIQIRLYDENMISRVTIPPVEKVIEVREPISLEDINAVDYAMVDSAQINDSGNIEEIFDINGSYIKTEWTPGDIISAAKLNKIEYSLEAINNNDIQRDEETNVRLNTIEERIDNIDPSDDIDLSDYAKTSDIPTKTSQLTNDTNFLTSVPSEYVTETELNAKGYLTQHQSLDNYATKSYVSSEIAKVQLEGGEVNLDPYALKEDIPTKLSDLQNDTNFLTSVPSEYVTETELNAKGYLTEHQDLSDYAKTSDIPTKTSELTNDSNFLTSVPSEYVTETELNAKGYLTEHQDLSDYAKTSDIPTKTSQLTNDTNFLTSVPSEYVTETELNAKGYLTSVPDEYELPDYYYENDYIIGKISEIQEFMDEAGADGLVFIDFSDSHIELAGEGMNGGNSGKIIRKIKEDCKIERVIYNGDATSNSPQETEALCLKTMAKFDDIVEPVGELFFMLGNHDGAYGLPVGGVTYPYNITRQKRFNRTQQRNRQGITKVFGEDGTYFYVDDPCQQHRFIIMNTSDKPYNTNDNGTMVTECNTMKGFAVRQPQIDFIINALKTTPEGWTVTSHAHIVFNNAFIATDAYIRNLFKAYKNKGKYSVSYDGVYGSAPVPQYTNLADVKSSDWLSNSRLNSSGVGSAVTGCIATNYIPVSKGDIIRVKGMDLTTYNTAVYDSPKAVLGSQKISLYSSSSYLSDITATAEGGQCKIQGTAIAYIRFSGMPVTTAENIIITKNEEIVEISGNAWDALEINVDFAESNGDYIAHFCGHAHNDYHYPASDYLIDMISVACDGRVSNNSYMTNEDYQNRLLGTIYEQVVDVKIINRSTHTINTVRIGAGENRTISY